MELIIPAILFYRDVVRWSLFVIPMAVMVMLLLFFRETERAFLLILFLALGWHMVYEAETRAFFSTSLPAEEVVALHGVVVNSPSRRKNRSVGFRMEVHACADKEGNVGSAKGVVYVISSFANLNLGDQVAVSGRMEDHSFLSSSVSLKEKGRWNRGRDKFSHLLEKHFGKGEAGNLGALLLSGSSLDGTSTLTEAARKYGLSHILALSGMHLSLFYLLLYPFFHFWGGEREGKWVTFLLLTFFVYSTGWKPSLLRALLFWGCSSLFGTTYGYLLSFVYLLKWNPLSVVELGTALSFLSLSGLLLFSKPVGEVLSFFLPHFPLLSNSMAASLSALVFSVPYSLSVFGSWQPMALFLAFPATLAITVFFFLEIASLVISPLEGWLEWLLRWLLEAAGKEPLLRAQTTLRNWWPMAAFALLSLWVREIYVRRGLLKEKAEAIKGEVRDILGLWR